MTRTFRRRGHSLHVGVVLALVLSVLSLWAASSTPAGATVPPIVEKDAGHVTTDVLPTVQVNGVVWDQEIVGNTVYAVGEFTQARPPGAAPGQNQTPRANILAYNLTTGQLIQSFNPSLNRQAKGIEASPDGSTLYVVGSFTSVNGQSRYRIAALDAVTGDLVPGFGAALDYTSNALTVTEDAVYVGGAFNYALGQSRPKLAAFSRQTGALLNWAPAADNAVHAMVTSPDGSRVFVGGSFLNVNGQTAEGVAAIDSQTGALLPWAANQVVHWGGSRGAVLTLKTDGTSILGGGYTYGRSGGNLEGVFKADPTTGEVEWIEDCHGDTYDVATANDYAYVVHHDHYCGNVGGFPQSENWGTNQHRALSFTLDARGTIRREPWSYHNWEGEASPSMVNWFPDLDVGSYTGQNQAAWDAEANGSYVVLGGEFPRVNNVAQQGLVRFAVKPIAPGNDGPRVGGANWPIRAQSSSPGTVRVTFNANWDRDDHSLSYRIIRNGNNGSPVDTRTVESTFWDRPIIGFDDTGLSPGQTYTYEIRVNDGDGNVVWSNPVQVTVATSGTPSAYATAVMNDGARFHWRFDENGGSTANPDLGFEDMTRDSGASFGASGAILGEGDGAVSVNGSSSARLFTTNYLDTSEPLTEEIWFRTSSTNGGRLMGFSNQTTSNSSRRGRVLYLTNNGRVKFGIEQPRPGSGLPGSSSGTGFERLTVESQPGLNNGQWHHAVATLGDNGMYLYIDGVKVASRSDALYGRGYNGFWRVGADYLSGWSDRPSSDSLTGELDEPAVYLSTLTPAQVANHYAASGRTPNLPPAPSGAYGTKIRNADPAFYYRLDETGGSTAQDGGLADLDGTYVNTVTRNQAGAISGNASAGFGSGYVRAPQAFGTGVYSAEAWFNTTTSSGGQIIGFGDSASGSSAQVDKQVYMRNDGRLVFTASSGTGRIQTTNPYRDGEWHHVVATQSSAGMALYVDGVLVGADTHPSAGSFFGYWRVGQDSTPGDASSDSFSGRIDEVAVYNRVLGAAEALDHYQTGGGTVTNLAPVASFGATANDLQVDFDASASNDTDGTIVGYSWDFGDGNDGTGVSPSHTYALGGTYQVTLTVTDDDGATGSLTQGVVVTAPVPNQPPTASFTHDEVGLQVNVDAVDSSDSDGSIVSYAWDFGDGGTATGVTASHTYAAGDTYDVTLTVTDDDGATGVTSTLVSVAPIPNQPPTASFTHDETGLRVDVDASGSSDSDGSIVSYAWDFGDGGTASGVTASHTYAVGAAYDVSLTVTDDDGDTGVGSASVSVAPIPNQPPTASFSVTPSGLTVGFDGSGSSDADGSIVSYAWDFGDGQTASGPTALHTYALAGTYPVSLTVTDDDADTATANQSVTVTAQVVVAADDFARTEVNSLGSASVGGVWSTGGNPANFAVGAGSANVTLPSNGVSRSGTLGSVSQSDVDQSIDFSLDQTPVGGGVYMSSVVRKVGNSEYRLRVRVRPGVTNLQLLRVVNNAESYVTAVTIDGIDYSANSVLHLRFRATGSGATLLQGKVWADADPEPVDWQISANDTTAALQGPGGVGFHVYISSSAGIAPATFRVDNLLTVVP